MSSLTCYFFVNENECMYPVLTNKIDIRLLSFDSFEIFLEKFLTFFNLIYYEMKKAVSFKD